MRCAKAAHATLRVRAFFARETLQITDFPGKLRLARQVHGREAEAGGVVKCGSGRVTKTSNTYMKLNRWFGLALATLVGLGAGSVLAQNNGNGGNGGNGGQGGGQNGFGGGRGFRNMDPAQRQQMMMDGIKSELEITDDSEWNALQPLVKKVLDGQQAVVGERMRGFFGRPRGGDNGGGGDQGGQRRGGGPGGMLGQPSPEAEALQRAVDSKASTAETKAALAKLVDARKNSQANLEKAQADLKKVLTVRQEAILTLRGLL